MSGVRNSWLTVATKSSLSLSSSFNRSLAARNLGGGRLELPGLVLDAARVDDQLGRLVEDLHDLCRYRAFPHASTGGDHDASRGRADDAGELPFGKMTRCRSWAGPKHRDASLVFALEAGEGRVRIGSDRRQNGPAVVSGRRWWRGHAKRARPPSVLLKISMNCTAWLRSIIVCELTSETPANRPILTSIVQMVACDIGSSPLQPEQRIGLQKG